MINFSDIDIQHKILSNKLSLSFKKTLKSNQFIGGDNISKFEKKFSNLLNIKFCLGVANGTDALEIAIKSLKLKKNSEVIVPASTWISTAEAVVQNGLKVKFVDVNENDSLINLKDLEKKISKKTSAIIVVHLFGKACDMVSILKIAKKYKLKIIEDCAQAHLAKFNNKYVGTLSDIATFSFYPGKNLGALGDAGCIVTNKLHLYKLSKKIANHGRDTKYQHTMIGRNSRLDNLQAGFLNQKISYLRKWTKIRVKNAKIYNQLLKKIPNISTPIFKDINDHVFHLYVIKCQKRDKLKNFLFKNNIICGLHYPYALPDTIAFKYLGDKSNKIASKLSKKILSLPMGIHLNKNKIIKVVTMIKKFYKFN
jgi:dTDP-4-amino-4,6-dideoxygalactose transaminase